MSRYLYISDVYCPWCYAFGRILDELLAEHPLPVRVLAGELVEEPQTIDDMVREMPSITAFFKRLAGASEVHVVPADQAPASKGQVEVVTHAARVFMPLQELVDVAQELQRIAKEKEKALGHLKGIEAKLNNEAFTSKAPANIVQNQRDQAEKLRSLIAQLEQSEAAMQG